MRTRTVRTAALTAVLGALALTACSSGAAPSSSAAGGASSATSTSTASSSAASQSAAPQSAAPALPVSSAASGAPNAGGSSGGASSLQDQAAGRSGGSAPCRTSQLKVAQVGADVGAGQYYSRLAFTNISSSTCTLTGYPGVSYVKGGGVQSGNAAQRTGGQSVVAVTLKPHGTASAVMHDSNGMGGYSPTQCQLTSVEGLRIYPPNEKAALFLPWKTRHCAGVTVHSLTISPVQDLLD